MPDENREGRADPIQVLFPWGLPSADAHEEMADTATLWLSGGAALLLWTAVALLLTSA